jgi:hypothetical protein
LHAVPSSLQKATARGIIWELNAGEFLMKFPGVARFLVSAGKEIYLDPEPGADLADALPFLLGTCWGALLLQRGALVLHGAAVAVDGRAYVFCGRSGIGKSSLVAALCESGCQFLNDDVCAVHLDDRGRAVVWPDGRRLKLFEESIRHLALNGRERGVVRPGIAKHYVVPPGSQVFGPVPVGGVYILRDQKASEEAGLRRLSLIEGAQQLLNRNYRARLSAAMPTHHLQVAATAAMLREAAVFTLTRPRDLMQLGETAAALRAHWGDGTAPKRC